MLITRSEVVSSDTARTVFCVCDAEGNRVEIAVDDAGATCCLREDDAASTHMQLRDAYNRCLVCNEAARGDVGADSLLAGLETRLYDSEREINCRFECRPCTGCTCSDSITCAAASAAAHTRTSAVDITLQTTSPNATLRFPLVFVLTTVHRADCERRARVFVTRSRVLRV